MRSLRQFGWLVQKDLMLEWRLRRVWPCTLLLGLLLVVLIEMQVELRAAEKQQVICGFLWLTIAFAGLLNLERSFSCERDDSCWRTLLFYPLSPATVFFAKVTVNVCALVALECFLIPAFVVFSDVPFLQHPFALALIAVLANIGCAAIGVLVSGLTASRQQKGSLLALLLLPLLAPLLLAASKASEGVLTGVLDAEWHRWLGFLAAYAGIFLTLGSLLFEHVIED